MSQSVEESVTEDEKKFKSLRFKSSKVEECSELNAEAQRAQSTPQEQFLNF
jgi:hypothetical protein